MKLISLLFHITSVIHIVLILSSGCKRALSLMWTLGAVSKPGAITKAEFISGLKKQKKCDVGGIKSMPPSLDPGFLERDAFRGLADLNCLP